MVVVLFLMENLIFNLLAKIFVKTQPTLLFTKNNSHMLAVIVSGTPSSVNSMV